MKHLKAIGVIALAVIMTFSLALADTTRQGSKSFSFNTKHLAQKTTNYTLTSSDDEVQFTLTAAATATLPSISTLGKKSFKIKKLDSTGFPLSISPASGDTIQGETSRRLTYKNAYIILTTDSNNSWTVSYESPLVLEDYKYGGVASYTYQTVAANTTLTTGDCGKTIGVGTDSLTITLPTAFAGCSFTFVNIGAAGNNILDIAAGSADAFYGTLIGSSLPTIVTSGTGSTLSNTKSTAKKGDYVKIVSPASATWVITGNTGTWTTK